MTETRSGTDRIGHGDPPRRDYARAAERGSISIWFVRKALAALDRRGLRHEAALRRAGVPSDLLRYDHSRVSPAAFSTLWLAVAAELDDEFFALDSRRLKVGSFAMLSRLVKGTRTLGEALRCAARFFNLLLDDTTVAVDFDSPRTATVTVRTRSALGRAPDVVFAHETLLIMLHGVLCWAAGRRIPIARASFGYARPAWWREYLDMYSTQLSFDAPATALLLTLPDPGAAIVQTRKTLRAFLEGAPENIILKYRNPASLSSRIRRQLRDLEPGQWPTAENLAHGLAVAPSTLHRRLAGEGTTYQGIKDALRRDYAISLLGRRALSITDIAIQLGYAEASSFQRAFRQWTGVRPGKYRSAAPALPGAAEPV